MSSNIKTVVWNVTKKCNLACSFCFGPNYVNKYISTPEAKKNIDSFKDRGYINLVFTGGEPLLRNDIIELIKFASKKGFYTILHTNGTLLTYGFLKIIENYLDQINLPLDGYDIKTDDELRTPGHFDKIMLVLSQLKNKDIKLIISTVACKKNIKYIRKIGKVLPSWINKWRVFQVRNVSDVLAVPDDKFEKLKLDNYPFRVQKVGREDREFDAGYVVINN